MVMEGYLRRFIACLGCDVAALGLKPLYDHVILNPSEFMDGLMFLQRICPLEIGTSLQFGECPEPTSDGAADKIVTDSFHYKLRGVKEGLGVAIKPKW